MRTWWSCIGSRCGATLGLMMLIGFFVTPVPAQEISVLDEEGRLVNFERDVVPIFRDNCLKCHNVDDAKGDFQIDDPDMVFSYVEPEDLESSTMYIDYMLSDDPDMLMPPPKHGGPLSVADLSTIRVWIEEGAVWPEGVLIEPAGEGEEAAAEETPPEAEAPQSLVSRVWAFQGFFHPATVHFPVALFTVGALFVVLGWVWPKLGDQVPLACLLLGAPSAIAATAMGFAFATEQGYGSWTKIDMDSEVFWHRWSGVIVSVTSLVVALVALKAVKSQSDGLKRVWQIGLLLIAGMVGAVGHQGGELSYGADFYPRAFRILLGTPEQEEVAESATTESATTESATAEATSEEQESGGEAS